MTATTGGQAREAELASDAQVLAGFAREAALAGAEVALAWTERRDDLNIEEKAASDDLVSQADREAEAAIRTALERVRPNDSVIGEEGAAVEGNSGVCWIVDPIDGTTDYLYGRPDWGVSVAAVREEDGRILAGCVAEPATQTVTEGWHGGGAWANHKPVACSAQADVTRCLVDVNFGAPFQRVLAGSMVAELLPRVRDLRRGGSAACALARVASGRAEAYWGPGLAPWDGSAGALLVAEAGGIVGDLNGQTGAHWPRSGNVLAAANESVWSALRDALAAVYDC